MADPDRIYWSLPGHGSKGDRCGPLYYMAGRQRVAGCVDGDRCHYGQLERFHCDRPQCTDWHCVMSWARDHAWDASDRLAGAEALYGDYMERLLHVSLSWDPSGDLSWMTSVKAFNKRIREAYRLLEEAGLRGGVGVFHPWRWAGEEEAESGGSKRFPRDALRNGLEWRIGPHFHAVGYGWIDGEAVARIYERTGIVITVLSGASGERFDASDAWNILAYCLSHAGVGVSLSGSRRNLRTLRPFGSCSSRSRSGVAQVMTIPQSEDVACPVCSGLGWVGSSPLYDLYSWMDRPGDPPPPVSVRRHYGVWASRSGVAQVRSDLAGLDHWGVLAYARENPDHVATRCTCPDVIRGMRDAGREASENSPTYRPIHDTLNDSPEAVRWIRRA